jgi:outer membrane lipoprotein-sorting protein
MLQQRYATSVCALVLFAAGGEAAPLKEVLARMDATAAAFKGMTAKIRRVSHTAVIDEDNIDSGTVTLKRSKPKEVQMLVELTEPEVKSLAFQGRKLEIYFPKILTVQEYDLGKSRALLEQFLLLGFGSTGKELAANYTIASLGEEEVGGRKAHRLELTPKSAEALQHLKKVELWIAADGGYPSQQKFFLAGGDFTLVTYTDVKLNPPLSDAALRLKLPKGVKREQIQK